MTPPLPLSVSGLVKAYGRHRVLDGVSFELLPGSVTVLAGTNGAGKSTLLRCLAGLASFEGRATLGAQALDGSAAARRLMGYVPQRVSLPESGTVGELLALFAALRGADARALPFPDGFLPGVERRLGVLSGGQQQRVVLAAALLGRPPLLLLDEPAANLDEAGRATLWTGLRAAAGSGATVLVASPSPTDLEGVAGHRLLLENGRLTAGSVRRGLHTVLPPESCGPPESCEPPHHDRAGQEVAR